MVEVSVRGGGVVAVGFGVVGLGVVGLEVLVVLDGVAVPDVLVVAGVLVVDGVAEDVAVAPGGVVEPVEVEVAGAVVLDITPGVAVAAPCCEVPAPHPARPTAAAVRTSAQVRRYMMIPPQVGFGGACPLLTSSDVPRRPVVGVNR